MKENITLIGMPGSGKSTIGVVLAKTCGMQYVDTDILIQNREGRLLQDIIDESGNDYFREIERTVLNEIKPEGLIVSTGGSAIYYDDAMNSLRESGKVIFLDVPLDILLKRLHNITTRGITMAKGETIESLFTERVPLYNKYSDIKIDCVNKNVEEIVSDIIHELHT